MVDGLDLESLKNMACQECLQAWTRKLMRRGVSFVRHAMGPCLEKKPKDIAGTSTASNIDQQSPHYLKED